MDRFEPIETLRAIEKYSVTHAQFVPTHLVRLLKLPADERKQFDLSSLRVVVHAAAPCPPQVKRDVLDWLGPVVYEYYSGSEGVGFCAIGPRGVVGSSRFGRSLVAGAVHVTAEDGTELAAGRDRADLVRVRSRFEYHGDPGKTAEAFNERGWSTLGDIGMVDEEGYLYFTDRVSNMVISGGVNIYPREIEDVLIGHPDVADVAVVGVEDAGPRRSHSGDRRTEPRIVPPSPAFATELIDYCRANLSSFKCPKSVVFVDELPRLLTGKIAKRMLPASALSTD